MLQNQLPSTYTMLQVGSPPSTLGCPYCLQHICSKGGRIKHIQVKHHVNRHNSHASNLTLPPSLSHSKLSSHNIHWLFNLEQPPSPNLSNSTPSPSPPPSHREVDAANNLGDIGIHKYPQFNQGYIPPDLNVGDELNEDLLFKDKPIAPDPPHHVKYVYHPKLDGK